MAEKTHRTDFQVIDFLNSSFPKNRSRAEKLRGSCFAVQKQIILIFDID